MKDHELSEEATAELTTALQRIRQGKTPPPMHDPYTGQPMNRAQRRAMKRKVAARIKRKEKGK